MNKYFITGIGTGIGKTLVSAILVEKLKADYWKPIQSGDLMQSDSMKISELVSNNRTAIHKERFCLNKPLSPHLSARIDDVSINVADFQIPKTVNHLIIEGAGGLMVPLNETELIIDLIKKLCIEVILVSENYLGSINHTLLSLAMLKQYNIPIKGIIFNGEENKETQSYILNYSDVNYLGRIPRLETINPTVVADVGQNINL